MKNPPKRRAKKPREFWLIFGEGLIVEAHGTDLTRKNYFEKWAEIKGAEFIHVREVLPRRKR